MTDIQNKEDGLENSLTSEEATKILFHSFKHSQGRSNLQRYIFMYLRTQNPDWKIDPDMHSQIFYAATNLFERYLFPKDEPTQKHPGLEFPEVQSNIRKMLFVWESILSDESPNLQDTIEHIASEILIRDNKYYQQGGRKGGSKDSYKSGHNPSEDRYLSYFCYYGIEEHSTGILYLDKMYKDVVDSIESLLTIKRYDKIGETNNHIIKVIRNYYSQKKHPGIRMPKRAENILQKAEELKAKSTLI